MSTVADDILAIDADTTPAVAALATWRTAEVGGPGPDPRRLGPARPPGSVRQDPRCRHPRLVPGSGQDDAPQPPTHHPPPTVPTSVRPAGVPRRALRSCGSARVPQSQTAAATSDPGVTPGRGGHPHRSQAIQKVALAAYCRSWTCDEFIAAILGSPLAAKAVSKNRDPHRYLRHCWGKAREYAASPTVNRDRDRDPGLASILAAMDATIWRKQAGVTDRHVLLAHVRLPARPDRSSSRPVSGRSGEGRDCCSPPESFSRPLGGWLTPARFSARSRRREEQLQPEPRSSQQLTPFALQGLFGGWLRLGNGELTRAARLRVDGTPAKAASASPVPACTLPCPWRRTRCWRTPGLGQAPRGGAPVRKHQGRTKTTGWHTHPVMSWAGVAARSVSSQMSPVSDVVTLEAGVGQEDEARTDTPRTARLDDLFRSGREAEIERTAASRSGSGQSCVSREGGYRSGGAGW